MEFNQLPNVIEEKKIKCEIYRDNMQNYKKNVINGWRWKSMNDDLISRQAAIDFIKDHSYPVRYDRTSIEQGMTLTGIEQALNEVPTVQPVQKTGRWIDDNCSECGQYVYHGDANNYCPNCGAKMESEE